MARVDARFGLTVYGPVPSVSKRHQVASPEADMSTGREHPYRLREEQGEAAEASRLVSVSRERVDRTCLRRRELRTRVSQRGVHLLRLLPAVEDVGHDEPRERFQL
jgi:hypothetical protein